MELRTSQLRARNSAGIHVVESRKPNRSSTANTCAQCYEPLFLPEWSEHLDSRRVRHLWECEACGYKFETMVYFPEI
jgi:hypothetical protein